MRRLIAGAGRYLPVSGSNAIVCRDRHFNPVNYLKARITGVPLRGINDLAWEHGRRYCNLLRDDTICAVSECGGKVLGILDCPGLRGRRDIPGRTRLAPVQGFTRRC